MLSSYCHSNILDFPFEVISVLRPKENKELDHIDIGV